MFGHKSSGGAKCKRLGIAGLSVHVRGTDHLPGSLVHSLVVASSTDDKKYALKFNPQQVNAWNRLHEGTNVSVRARFDGENYTAEDVAVLSAAVQ